MKTILEINSINYSSTGNITLNIAKTARKEGYKVYTSCKYSRVGAKFQYEDQIYIGSRLERVICEELAYITGLKDHFNIIGTYKFLKKIDEIKPDLIHLHSLTDTYINLNMLFKYIRKHKIPVVWTFHDAWAMTGQCFVFETIGCRKWIEGCGHCPQLQEKPASLFLDNTSYLWHKKKKMFTSIPNMTIVTPSNWLKDLVKQSFFKDYPVKVINNGINLDLFKPEESDFREKNNIQNSFIILGVAARWPMRKGLDVFIRLAKELPDKFKIVMVGTNEETDKLLPENILSIHKTFNQQQLVEIYTAADLFITPTREDNFPTVNIEALACGTPVLTYRTGGSPEIINEKCGSVVEKNDYEAFKNEIIRIEKERPYSKQDCIDRAKEFDMNKKFSEYTELFKQILKDS